MRYLAVWGKRIVIFEILMVVLVLYIEVGRVKVINTTQLCGNTLINNILVYTASYAFYICTAAKTGSVHVCHMFPAPRFMLYCV